MAWEMRSVQVRQMSRKTLNFGRKVLSTQAVIGNFTVGFDGNTDRMLKAMNVKPTSTIEPLNKRLVNVEVICNVSDNSGNRGAGTVQVMVFAQLEDPL